MHKYVPVDSPWLNRTVRITKTSGPHGNDVGPIVKVDRRHPDTYHDGCTYWVELTPNYRVGCKWGDFQPVT